MDMIDLAGVKQMEPGLYDSVMKTDKKSEKQVKEEMTKSKSTVQKLGDWVKKTVNCCIE